MLLPRIITALILIPIVILGILYFPPVVFALVAALLFILAANEWSDICEISTLKGKIGFILTTCLVMALFYFSHHEFLILLVGSLLWFLPMILVIFYQPERFRFLQKKSVRIIIGILALSLAWYALVIMRNELNRGPESLIFLCLLVWTTDIFAYFSGRKWGKRKLAPLISPGKTWAGFWGGLVGAIFISMLVYLYIGFNYAFNSVTNFSNSIITYSFYWLPFVCFICVLAVIGDLFESLMKRIAGVKDSGSLLPGHGGILDRIDSLISTLPFSCLIFYVLTLAGAG